VLTNLLLSVVFFAAAFSVISIAAFVVTAQRVVSWSEIFFSDGFIIAIALLPVIHAPVTRRFLYVSAVLCFMALLTAQTRSIWISTLLSFLAYGFLFLIKSRTVRIKQVVRIASIVLSVILVTHVLVRVTVNLDLPGYVAGRMFHTTHDEFRNAGSSMGYRIYESYMVWRNRTVLGHGSGARIHLLFTQRLPLKFIDWWGIHSGYFDMLHKYGFLGLALYGGIILLVLKRAISMMRSRKRAVFTFGIIVFLTVMNHSVISATSQYIFKENVMIYLVLCIGIVERYRPPRPRKKFQKALIDPARETA
jgi:hypothetical protein